MNLASVFVKHRRLLVALAALGTVLCTLATVPRCICGWDADAVFDGAGVTLSPFAERVALARHYYETGNSRFDGQSAVAIDQMTIMGLSQIIQRHPEQLRDYLPPMQGTAAHLADPQTLAYATQRYGHSGLVSMGNAEGHAYLGYINLGLGMLRAVDPDTEYKALNDRLSVQLAERLFSSPTGLIETYPGETWPPDVAAVAGSIGLQSKLAGVDRSADFARWKARFSACAIDKSGYLVQRVRSGTCIPVDAPRGSGTAVAAYFLSFADHDLSRQLHQALEERTLFGFSAIREYAPGFSGNGDGNAGPMVFGVSVGATGFALGSAAANRDRALFRRLYRTLDLFGVPAGSPLGRGFATGGGLGDALLLAMLSARPS